MEKNYGDKQQAPAITASLEMHVAHLEMLEQAKPLEYFQLEASTWDAALDRMGSLLLSDHSV